MRQAPGTFYWSAYTQTKSSSTTDQKETTKD